jgi:hypothetical protein
VWSPDDGALLQTLEDHDCLFDGHVYALAVGPDGEVFSSSLDGTVRVCSGVDGALLYTLGCVLCLSLAVMANGTLCAGNSKGEVVVWR